MSYSFPESLLLNHVAILGKTGAGKSSTARLAVEQVARAGGRVCILDPIKSDWWGLTSSRDGQSAGLPFHILGGPHGHVPLPSTAGKAVGELVATGALPLSIVDMADFEPGGLARFFNEFAPALLRKMTGVLYLVLEESHEFAPKERAGIGAENLLIHYAKKLATAGRSKGVRLVLVTQRTQALHNAMLGSCETLIAHRLTAPADQGPVLTWLKANVSKQRYEEVSTSLSSLKTGEGWICSGESAAFARVQFPKIATFDSSATPTGDGAALKVETAAVDLERLRGLIGAAVDEAKAHDPKILRARIEELENRLLEAEDALEAGRSELPQTHETKACADCAAKDREIWDSKGLLAKAVSVMSEARNTVNEARADMSRQVDRVVGGLNALIPELSAATLIDVEGERLGAREAGSCQAVSIADEGERVRAEGETPAFVRLALSRDAVPRAHGSDTPPPARRAFGKTTAEQRVIDALAWWLTAGVSVPTRQQVAFVAGYTVNGHFNNIVGGLRTRGLVDYPSGGGVTLKPAGAKVATRQERRLTRVDLRNAVVDVLKGDASRRIFLAVYNSGRTLTREELASATGYTVNGHFNNMVGALRSIGVIEYPHGGGVVLARMFDALRK